MVGSPPACGPAFEPGRKSVYETVLWTFSSPLPPPPDLTAGKESLHLLSPNPYRLVKLPRVDMKLEPPDSFHLRAAEGWLELGNPLEAREEIKQLAPELQMHPDVLAVRWSISCRTQEHDLCLELGKTLLALEPDRPGGWIATAQSLYFRHHYQDAYDTLSQALEKFPEYWPVFYDLACYACLLDRFEEAITLLQKAFSLDKTTAARDRAAEDPDFEKLRQKIGKL